MKYEKSMKFNIASYSPPADASSVSAGPLMAGRSFPKKNSRAYTDIALACLIICIPMLTLSAGLLGIIYAYRVIQRDSDLLFSESSDGVDIDPSAYLVNYSATRLITIASWTSSVAPLLPGFVMTLLSFPAARRFLRTSQAGQEHSLPTPYQLGLYLQILTGGVSSLWQWIKYRSWSKREKQTSVVTLLVLHLSSATIVGLVIFEDSRAVANALKGMRSWLQTLGYTSQRQLLYISKSTIYHSQSYKITAAACTLPIAARDRAS